MGTGKITQIFVEDPLGNFVFLMRERALVHRRGSVCEGGPHSQGREKIQFQICKKY